jgi:hypothetical protein
MTAKKKEDNKGKKRELNKCREGDKKMKDERKIEMEIIEITGMATKSEDNKGKKKGGNNRKQGR